MKFGLEEYKEIYAKYYILDFLALNKAL